MPADGSLLMFLAKCLDRRLGGNTWMDIQKIEKKEDKTIRVINGEKIAEQIDKLGGRWGKIVEAEFESETKQIEGSVKTDAS